MNDTKGTVYWFTGVSGVGKTTIASAFCDSLKKRHNHAVFLDGDILRDVYGNDLGHSREDRLKGAMRNAKLCKMLSDQGFDVVCATISLFHSCQEWNREHIPNYREIFLKASLETLKGRDLKGLYQAIESGTISNIVGIDIPAEVPLSPDITIENNGKVPPDIIVSRLLQDLSISKPTPSPV